MSKTQFVHLHTHSHYSLLDGLPKIDEFVQAAKAQGATALALTDHGAMYGVIEFYQKCTQAGIKPIIGVEMYVAPNGLQNKRAKVDERNHHLILLAKNYTGYLNLLKLVTIAHLEGYYYHPRIDHAALAKHAEGLICLSACLKGEIPGAILNDELKRAEELIRFYQRTFGQENFYLELQHHPALPNQAVVNAALKSLSQKTDAPLVATADSHYLNPDDAEAQDILLCIHMKRQLADQDRMTMRNEDVSLKTPDQMAELFADTPEAIENTVKIAEACSVEIPLGQVQLPHYDVPSGKTPESYLAELAHAGIRRRYGKPSTAVMERLTYELDVINKTGFAAYFLIVQDFVNWAKNSGIVVGPGRGSAAGSIVSYLLNITNIDPLRYDLLFERFLNPERISMPDIDIDFADTRRDEVLAYVESKYGRDHVAQIITFGTMAARAAIRDVGRVLGLPYAYCDRVAKLIPFFNSLQQAIGNVPELRDIYDNDPEAKRLLDAAMKLEGVARHSSRHACGVVITKQPLDQHVPLQFASPEDQSIISQYSLHPIEDLGLLKMDFLGLTNLTILETCINIIKQTRGESVSLDDIPLDNKPAFKLLQKGDTTGVFQLESGGMRRYLRDLKPTNLEDIIAMVALYRPGPMDLIPSYIARKHGREPIEYIHPIMEKVLKNTYGIIVYQEQVMDMATELAGMTKGQGYLLIKAVGKKIKKLLDEQKDKFISACEKNGVTARVAQRTWELIEPFARYGFNKAHSACYATIAYQTAYFKANYPAEFMAALLTADQHNTDRIALEVDETRRMGLQVLPPDVNESFATFTVVPDSHHKTGTIRFGLSAIKNVGDNLVQAIIQERKAHGPFMSLQDFLSRVQHKDLNKKSLESLAKVGALDAFGERQSLIDNINDLLKYAKRADDEAQLRQTNLFSHLPTQSAPILRLKPGAAASKSQRGQWERQLLGLFITNHPLGDYRDHLERIATPLSSARERAGRRVTVAGLMTTVKRIVTKTNDRMAFVRLEDLTGSMEIVVFPKLFQETAAVWQEEAVVVIEGQITNRDGEWKILANSVKPLQLDALPMPVRVAIAMETANATVFDQLKGLFAQFPGDRPVELVVRKGANERRIATKHTVALTDTLRQSLEGLLGDCILEE